MAKQNPFKYFKNCPVIYRKIKGRLLPSVFIRFGIDSGFPDFKIFKSLRNNNILAEVLDESELVSELENNPALARTKLLPLDKRSGSVFLVILSAVEMPFLDEIFEGILFGHPAKL